MREFWEDAYAEDDFIFGTEPNVFLTGCTDLLQPGQHALALADGEGRNGVWLAQQGLKVHSVDFSSNALQKARQLARMQGVAITFEEADLFNWSWPKEDYDVIVAIFVQFAPPDKRDQLFRHMKDALKPGGLLLLEGYTPKQLDYKTGGPSNADNLYTESLLRNAFDDWEILELREYEAFLTEGTRHYGQSALIDLVARKPL